MVSTLLRPSSPPTEIVEYEFSYSRSTGMMRWRHQGETWYCKSITGQAWCRRADGEAGQLFLVGQLAIAELIDVPIIPRPQEWGDFPQGRHSRRWRLCLNRARKMWRIRDDDVDAEKIWNTNGYRGIINIRWMDSGPHIHVDQGAWLDQNGVVQFNG